MSLRMLDAVPTDKISYSPSVTIFVKKSSTSAPATPTQHNLIPCKAEHLALGGWANDVTFSHWFASDLGFPQHAPTTILEDNQPATKILTVTLSPCPQISFIKSAPSIHYF